MTDLDRFASVVGSRRGHDRPTEHPELTNREIVRRLADAVGRTAFAEREQVLSRTREMHELANRLQVQVTPAVVTLGSAYDDFELSLWLVCRDDGDLMAVLDVRPPDEVRVLRAY